MSDQPPVVCKPAVAFKIVDAAEWAVAVANGAYGGSAVDIQDGFIHLSTQDQLAETASRHYAGRTGLLLLTVDLAAIGDGSSSTRVVWEPSRGGALFPHLYGPMPVDAVVEAQPFQPPAGTSVL